MYITLYILLQLITQINSYDQKINEENFNEWECGTDHYDSTLEPHFENGEQIFECDMILKPEEYTNIDRKSLAALPGQYWPEGKVKYAIHSNLSENREFYVKSFKYIEEKTCLRFKEVEVGSNINHVFIINGTGCSSYVGRQRTTTAQLLKLAKGCHKRGIFVHEVAHAIGLYHEQSRYDRDKYVIIFENNVKPDKWKDNFEVKMKSETVTYNLPYDYGSIMHYPARAFAKNNKNTITARDHWEHLEMGQRGEFSFLDTKLINMMYNCSGDCREENNCQNGGFRDQTCQCICPPDFSGPLCEMQTKINSMDCGGEIKTETTIVAKNTTHYSDGIVRCTWWIKAPINKKVQVCLRQFRLPDAVNARICNLRDYIDIRWQKQTFTSGSIYCGSSLMKRKFQSEGNTMLIFLSYTPKTMKNFAVEGHVTFVE